MSRPSAVRRSEMPEFDDFARSISYLLGAIANLLSVGGSRLYRRAFKIGLGEWRLMWVLAIAPRITARRASQIIGLDEAAISRALSGLERRGLVRVAIDPSDRRQRIIELSEAGTELHGRILVVAQERERRLLASFTKDEIRLLRSLLRRLHARAAAANAFDPGALLAAADRPRPIASD